jgi:hypothetical protein
MTNLDISHQMLPAKPFVWRLFGGPQRESFFLTGAYRDLIRNDFTRWECSLDPPAAWLQLKFVRHLGDWNSPGS